MGHRGHLMDEADQALWHHLIRLAFPCVAYLFRFMVGRPNNPCWYGFTFRLNLNFSLKFHTIVFYWIGVHLYSLTFSRLFFIYEPSNKSLIYWYCYQASWPFFVLRLYNKWMDFFLLRGNTWSRVITPFIQYAILFWYLDWLLALYLNLLEVVYLHVSPLSEFMLMLLFCSNDSTRKYI
jgi:hypothetical protein